MGGIEGVGTNLSEITEISHGSEEISTEEIGTVFKKKLASLGPYPKEGCIFKVPVNLRRADESVYLPRIISIGPLHHHHHEGKLQDMEIYKEKYLKQYLKHTGKEVGRMVEEMRGQEEKVRRAYFENQFPPNFGNDEVGRKNFITMMLLDGCFIVWLFFLSSNFTHSQRSDPIMFATEYIQRTIYYDLLLVENQLPFFLLEHIFSFIRDKELQRLIANGEKQEPCTFKELTLNYFRPHITGEVLHLKSSGVKVKHLVDFLLNCYWPVETSATSQTGTTPEKSRFYGSSRITVPTHELPSKIETFLDIRSGIGGPEMLPELENDNFYLPSANELNKLGAQFKDGNFHLPSATELNKLGVQFKVAKRETFLDITFEGGVLEMPLVFVDESTETIFRNIVAMEQCQCATYYMGSDEEVCRIFNSMLSGVFRRKAKKSHYNKIIEDLDNYSQKSWNQWKAKVIKDYFSTPMTVLSLIAAFVLLAGTVMQTVYTVIPFYHK